MSYQAVMSRVAGSARRAARAPEEITVVAVSKEKTPEEILSVYEQGHRDFGENRAQDLASKAEVLPRDIRWHFVGALQSNKVRLVRPRAYLLHSMDRRSLAASWLKGAEPAPPVLIQVNLGDESQKSGVDPEAVGDTLAWMTEMGLDIRGLMAIPPIPRHPEESRPYFRTLARIRDWVRVDYPVVTELSIGMTDDFEIAVEEGASIIRVGRAIFGPRN